MKNIEVSDEMYSALMEISKEITTQDNRCTAMPYFFQVQETKKGPAHEGSGEEVWWNAECETELRTDDEKRDWLYDDEDSRSNYILDLSVAKARYTEMDTCDLNEAIEAEGFEKFYEEDKKIYSNAFFTSKGCDEHIRINGHNLHNPVNYLSHAYRNQEMELMFKFLCGLLGKEIHK